MKNKILEVMEIFKLSPLKINAKMSCPRRKWEVMAPR